MSDVPKDHDPMAQDGDEIPWKPPVIAAIVGALLMATFVIYAVVSGPVDDPEADSLAARPAPSKDLPPAYIPLLDPATQPDGVGIKIESVDRDGGSSTVVVSSAVPGTVDPSQVSPPDVAYWELGPAGNRVLMESQFASDGVPGTITVVFPTELVPSEEIVVAYPVVETAATMREVEIGPEMIGEAIPITIEFESDIAISGTVTVGGGWGYVEWSVSGASAATLDVEATFAGTENAAGVSEPVRLVPVHDSSLALPGMVTTPRPLYATGGTYGLHGDGRSPTDGGEVTSIVITLRGTVVTATGSPVVLEPISNDG